MVILHERLSKSLADRYRLERELGRGGMATVYLAEDLEHHRHVAIKVLSSEISALIGSDRFLREIEIAARLSLIGDANRAARWIGAAASLNAAFGLKREATEERVHAARWRATRRDHDSGLRSWSRRGDARSGSRRRRVPSVGSASKIVDLYEAPRECTV